MTIKVERETAPSQYVAVLTIVSTPENGGSVTVTFDEGAILNRRQDGNLFFNPVYKIARVTVVDKAGNPTTYMPTGSAATAIAADGKLTIELY